MNSVELVGKIVEQLKLNNECYGNRYYVTEILCKRQSGIDDILPLILPESLIEGLNVRETIYLRGSFKSFNNKANKRVELYIYAEEIEYVDVEHMNNIQLEGYICKKSEMRKTPKGRMICDVVVATNRTCGQSDYIPCVLWERNAKLGSELSIGQKVLIEGRIQSRVYEKKFADHMETRTAYEVSVSHLIFER